MRLYFNLLLCLFSITLVAQQGTTLNLTIDNTTTKNISEPIDISLEKVEPFLAYSLNWDDNADNETIEIRFSADRENWTAWTTIDKDSHADRTDGKAVSQLQFADKTMHYAQLRTENLATENVDLRLYSPGKSTAQQPRKSDLVTSRECPTRFPDLLERDQWCPDGSCPENSIDPASTVPTHLIIHHSAGPNGASDWAAVVRSFWDFHVNTNGWSDIGYNYLVDPDGKLYEGRGNNVLGAHFCGKNRRTMGVCVIGDFTNIKPTEEARSMLTKILAWKACDRNIEPIGASMHNPYNEVQWNIAGHRDGCATACPGDLFYPDIPEVRQDVVDYIAAGGDFLAAPSDLQGQLNVDKIELNWSDNANNETAFQLERSVLYPNSYEPLATLDPDVTTYTDEDITLENRYYYRLRVMNEIDTTAFTEPIEVLTLATNTEDVFLNQNTVQISPNPFRKFINITIENELRTAARVEVFSANGQQRVIERDLPKNGNNTQLQIDLSGQAAGVYFIKITQGTHQFYQKIIKQ
ncbi:MAG: N-acetylmuramoyl-L-alanine amidase [Saprospiraceae bacterium]